MRNVIITGVTGFVGSYFALEMLHADCEVYGVARNPKKISAELKENEHFHIIESTLEALNSDLFDECSYDGFFHFAWGGVNREEIDDCLVHQHNYNNSVNCLNCAIQLKCACFLDAGSRMEYGRVEGIMHEELEPHPDKEYGIWKEKFYRYAFEKTKDLSWLDYIHIRIFSVIGLGDHPWSVTDTAVRKFLAGEKMTFGPCTQLWNFMAIEDAVKAIRLLYENRDHFPPMDNRIVNVANFDTRVLRGFIEEMYQICRSRSELVFLTGDAGTSTNAGVDKLYRITGWKSEIPYYQQITKIADTYREKREGK